jgi:hypothetical protein
MYVDRTLELSCVLLWELKTSSYAVYGPPVEDPPVEIELRDVIEQLHQNINTYWTSWITKHSSLRFGGLLLACFPRLTEWGILGVARQLYTLETGGITSKLKAGIFCVDKLPHQFRSIMLTAIETRRINKTALHPSFKRAKETLRCMSFIIAEFNKKYDAAR